jgi:hypothetical protein
MARPATLDRVQIGVALVCAVERDVESGELVDVAEDEVGGDDEVFGLESYIFGLWVVGVGRRMSQRQRERGSQCDITMMTRRKDKPVGMKTRLALSSLPWATIRSTT